MDAVAACKFKVERLQVQGSKVEGEGGGKVRVENLKIS